MEVKNVSINRVRKATSTSRSYPVFHFFLFRFIFFAFQSQKGLVFYQVFWNTIFNTFFWILRLIEYSGCCAPTADFKICHQIVYFIHLNVEKSYFACFNGLNFFLFCYFISYFISLSRKIEKVVNFLRWFFKETLSLRQWIRSFKLKNRSRRGKIM